jgi:hypothetical protein
MASTSTEPFIGESLLNTVNNITVKLGIKTIVVPQIDNKLRKYFRGLFKVNNENIENIELERWLFNSLEIFISRFWHVLKLF